MLKHCRGIVSGGNPVSVQCRSVKIRLCAALGVLLAAAGCGQKTEALPPAAPPPPRVSAVVAETRDVPLYLEGIGKCVSPEIVSIQPQVSGRITAIHFTEGTEVKKGQPLFSIDPRPFQIRLNQAKAEHAMNQAALKQSEATLKQSEAMQQQQQQAIVRAQAMLSESKTRQKLNVIEFERAKGLFETNAVARQEFDTRQVAVDTGEAQIKANEAGVGQAQAELEKSKAEVAQAQAAIDVAKAKLAASQAAIASAELDLEYASIHAPIDGRVGQRHADVGNVVMANSNPMPLVVLQTLDPIFAEFTVPESEYARIQAGLAGKTLSVECWAPEASGKARAGDVFFLDTSVQDKTGTLRLRARIQNEDRAFWPGQFVNFRLVLSTLKNANLAPATAIQIGQAGTFVYVVKPDSTVEFRPVKAGLRYGSQVAVLEGLNAGEQVVTAGHLMLQPGVKVQVDTPAKPDAPKSADASKNGDGAK